MVIKPHCALDIMQKIIEDTYDIVRWIDDTSALVHYWDEDEGDYYEEQTMDELAEGLYVEDDGMTSCCVKRY